MSTRYNNGSHYENHQRADELQDPGAHAHRTGEQQGKQDHLTGTEHSRQAHEHLEAAHRLAHPNATFGHNDIAARAHEIWESKGRPEGSHEQDWFEAVKELRARALAARSAS